MVTREVTENKADTTASKAPMNAAEAIAAAQKATNTVAGTSDAPVNERGFQRVFDKHALVGKMFTIVDWDKTPGEFGIMYDLNIVRGTKALWVRDGGSGIGKQLESLAEKGIREMIRCPKGLRVSEYENNVNGQMSTTFYLDDDDL